jgi:hypothetical protein
MWKRFGSIPFTRSPENSGDEISLPGQLPEIRQLVFSRHLRNPHPFSWPLQLFILIWMTHRIYSEGEE